MISACPTRVQYSNPTTPSQQATSHQCTPIHSITTRSSYAPPMLDKRRVEEHNMVHCTELPDYTSPTCLDFHRRLYEYSVMSTTGNAIRIIKLLPGSFEKEIRCKIFESRTDSILRRCNALSYTWGSSEQAHCIILNDRCMPVTVNLLVAFRFLRSRCS
jgi:hypothetical protein